MGRGHACHDTYRNFQELILSFHHRGPGGLNSGHQASDRRLDPLSHLSGLVMGSDCFLVSHLCGMCRDPRGRVVTVTGMVGDGKSNPAQAEPPSPKLSTDLCPLRLLCGANLKINQDG